MAPEFTAAEAATAETVLRGLYKHDVFIQKTAAYAQTAAELDVALKVVPTTADGFAQRGWTFAGRDRIDEAIADFDKAIALDPKNATYLAARGLVRDEG